MGAYIGVKHREPGDNTLAYYPLNSKTTINDMKGGTGTKYNLTTNGTYNFNTYQGVDCFNSQGTGSLYNTSLTTVTVGTTFSVSCWVFTAGSSNAEWGLVGMVTSSGGYKGWDLMENRNTLNVTGYRRETLGSSNYSLNQNYELGKWHHIVGTYTTGTNNQKFYIDGVLVKEGTNTMNTNSGAYLWIAQRRWGNGSLDPCRYGGISNVIIENIIWSADNVRTYFNQTKHLYGLQ